MTQRAEIAEKYSGLYSTIEGIVANVVSQSSLPPETLYKRLKVVIPAAWVTANWVNTHRGSDLSGPEPSEVAQSEYAKALLREPVSWRDGDERKSGTRADYYKSTDALFARTFVERLTGCDLVLDLGCGWGHRMVDQYLLGLDTQFVGGDRSDHSRRIIAALGTLFPKARLNWFQFDFLNPDFAGVEGSFRNVGVFTCHAIEQVEKLGPAFFDALMRRFDGARIRGVHVEPIASQIDSSRRAEADYARARRYNTDLYALVKTHPALRVTEAKAMIHDAGDGNASSLLTWELKS